MNSKLTTQSFRVLSPGTLRSYEQAARDFNLVMGKHIDQADMESAEAWHASMSSRGLAVGTIRSRLSALKVISGVKIQLPKRQKPKRGPTLSADQVRKVMSVVTKPQDRMLLVRLLTLGKQARMPIETPDMEPREPLTLHLPGMIVTIHFTEISPEKTLSAQEVTRKIKRYAKRAGLNEKKVNMMVWCQSGRMLMDGLGPIELVNMIGHNPEPSQGIEWKRLHGIGRRSKRV